RAMSAQWLRLLALARGPRCPLRRWQRRPQGKLDSFGAGWIAHRGPPRHPNLCRPAGCARDREPMTTSIPLLSGERMPELRELVAPVASRPPSALAALTLLTRAKVPRDIGAFGPAIAATAANGREAIGELHLFEAVFGRDSLHIANVLAPRYPRLLL